MSSTEGLGEKRNRERAEKLDEIARRARALPNAGPGGYDASVSFIRPDCDLEAVFGSMRMSLLDATTPSNTTLDLGDLPHTNQLVKTDPACDDGMSATNDGESFNPDEDMDFSDLLTGPLPPGFDPGFKPEAAEIDEPTPIQDRDDFAFSVYGSDLASTINILRMPSDRFRCIKVKLTNGQATFSAFDKGCFAQRSIPLVNEPIGIGSEAVVFLLSAVDLSEVSDACDVIVHMRVDFDAKRAWLSSANFQRPLALQSRARYMDRTEADLGTAEAPDVEEIDGTAWQIAARRLGVLAGLTDVHDEGHDLILFKDYEASYVSNHVLGLLRHNGLLNRRMVIRTRWLPLLYDALPYMHQVSRRFTTRFEIFNTNDVTFGIERVSRRPKTFRDPAKTDEKSTLLLPLSGFVQFLHANNVAGGEGFEITMANCGTGIAHLKGDRFGGRQVRYLLDGRCTTINGTGLRLHLRTSPLIDLLKGSEPLNPHIDFDFDRGLMHFAISDIHNVEARYIIALERKFDKKSLVVREQHEPD